MNGFDVFYSDDDINYTFFGSFNLTVSGGGEIPAQIVPLAFTARYIRFSVTSNFGDESYTGLSEVAFDVGPYQQQPTTPIPTLSNLMLMVLILLLAGMAVVRFRSN